jgi:hypothetical protein
VYKLLDKRRNIMKKRISSLLIMLMMLALAMSACGKDNKKEVNTQPSAVEVSVAEETPVSVTEISVEEVDPGLEIVEEFVILGEGQKNFNFDVTFADGNIKHYVINTDKETVGDALLELDIIAGDDSEYGLYVKSVDGQVADFDKDGTYWAFYINGQYASTGVDSTNIENGATYEFKVEK